MGEFVPAKEMVVEEVAVGAVPHVVKQTRHPEQFLDAVRGRGVRTDLFQRRVEMSAELARHVHRSQGMLKPGMLRRRIDPAGALELVDPPEALHPGGVDQILLGFLVAVRRGNGEGGVPVDRIGDQRHPLIDTRIFGGCRLHGGISTIVGAK